VDATTNALQLVSLKKPLKFVPRDAKILGFGPGKRSRFKCAGKGSFGLHNYSVTQKWKGVTLY